MPVNDELQKIIKDFDIISFDVFDTLLISVFLSNDDKFDYIGKFKNLQGFKISRIKAENKARYIKQIKSNKLIEDVTLQDIYDYIDDEYKALIDIEKRLDLYSYQKNIELCKVYSYALSQNKKIIIVSDTYYDANFLSRLLNKNGYNGFGHIFSSSDTGKMKSTGNLYKYVTESLGVKAGKILHIGDNKKVDFEKALENGLSAFHYSTKANKLKKITPQMLAFYNKYSVYFSPIIGIQLLNTESITNYWEKLGYNVGGVLCYSFLLSIIQIANTKNISDIFFVARDCYIFSKIDERLFGKDTPRFHYIYANRQINKLYNNVEIKDNDFSKYINSLDLKGGRVLVVDTCAKTFSAQTLITKYLNNAYVEGLYFSVKYNDAIKYSTLTSYDWEHFHLFNWNFVEFLLSSYEKPVIDIKDLKPVYQNDIDRNEEIRLESYIHLYRGNFKFMIDFHKVFRDFPLCIPMDIVFEFIGVFWNNLTETDKEYLSKIKHPIDSNQKTYISILSPKKDIFKLLHSIIK